MTTLGRYFHTLRYLRPAQVLGRVWFGIRRPRPDFRSAPPSGAISGQYVAPVQSQRTLIAPDVVRLLNVERQCAKAEDWDPPGVDRLWIYNLHYFDDLNSVGAEYRKDWHERLMRRWIDENPPGRPNAWDPYPVSRRIVNWVKWAARGNALPSAARTSLAMQSRWLMQRLEFHIQGNHLLTNGKALVHAGVCFAGPEADRWYSRGMSILERELPEQILPDGGHFERSPMYHAAALEDLLDLVNILRAGGRNPPTEWLDVIARMRRWLAVMTHPDGEIAFFNDSAFGVSATSAELEQYAARLELAAAAQGRGQLVVLSPSGYVRALAPSVYLVCDCAPVGPDHLPAHAHADTLSFELSLHAQRILVNSGTSQYGSGAERQRQRGTAAHNTVLVNRVDSSEVWAGFRVARRARAQLHLARPTPRGVEIEASHEGYRRLPGRNEHRRRWLLDAESLRIEDRITGEFDTAQARFYIHPDLTARQESDAEVLLGAPDGRWVRISFENAAVVGLASATWHPRFGVRIANCCVTAVFRESTLRTCVRWAGGE